jgi:hypothetical protein
MVENKSFFIEKGEGKVTLGMVKVSSGMKAPTTTFREFKSMTALKAWCKTHFPVKFPKKKINADA